MAFQNGVLRRGGKDRQVGEGEADVENDADFQAENVDVKMPEIVIPDTIVYPRAVVVLFGYAAVAAAAMFGSQRFAHHTLHAEIFLVEFPKREQLLNNRPLLVSGRQFRHPAWILEHGEEVEVASAGVGDGKHEV